MMMKQHSRRIFGGAVAALLVAAGVGVASPALAADGEDGERLPVSIAAAYSGVADGVAGEVVTIDVTVDTGLLGAADPTGLVYLGDASGEPVSISNLEDGDGGQTTLSFRPLRVGDHEFTVQYEGDATYEPLVVDMPIFPVTAAPTDLGVSFAYDAAVGDVVAYGGGLLDIGVSVSALLGSSAGQPTGTIHMYVNDTLVVSEEIEGSSADGADYADVSADLNNPDPFLTFYTGLQMPEVMLGTELADVRVEFVSSNWFQDASWEGSVTLLPVTTVTTIIVGDPADPATEVSGPATIIAFVDPIETFNHPTGWVQFYIDGEAYGDPVEIVEGAAFVEWTPTENGDVVLGAEYFPDRPNFLSSVTTDPYWLRATLPATPDTTPDTTPASNGQASPAELARTGGETAALSAGAAMLLLAGVALLVLRRRVA